MDFNVKQYIELVQESKKLRLQGKLLENSKSKELTFYLTLISDNVYYRSKNKYLKIFELYVNDDINITEFGAQFNPIYSQDKKIVEALEQSLRYSMDFRINPKSSGFKRIISDVFFLLEFDETCTEEEVKEWIYNSIREIDTFY